MLKVYNTLSRKKEVFLPRSISKRLLRGRPKKGGKVDIFVCGPTCYDFSHLGHARTYVVFDMIVKYLKEKDFNVFYLQNITDIDDKIIKRAKAKRIKPEKLARYFEKEYLKDMKSLKIDSPTKYARATDYIKEIISQVKRLLEKGVAYEIGDGIYYDISKFKDYGKLSRRTVSQAEDAVSRIDETRGKKNKGDFCLWKFSKPGEPKWPSPWGPGRPGWHIEDTAITERFFGPQYDVHGGARDLIFPHHEAEIAQMEAISGKKPMVKYWLHPGFLTVRGEKMAKSLGNFITVKNFLKKNSPRILRLLLLNSRYRSPLDYNEKLLSQTKKQIERIDEFVDKLQRTKNPTPGQARCRAGKKQKKNESAVKSLILRTRKKFEEAMEDDFNTPVVLSSIFQLINRANQLFDKNRLTSTDAKEILKFLRKIDKAFNFIFWGKRVSPKIPSFIKKMIKEREKARKRKDWKKADEIRREIKKLGYWVEDTKKRPKIKRIA